MTPARRPIQESSAYRSGKDWNLVIGDRRFKSQWKFRTSPPPPKKNKIKTKTRSIRRKTFAIRLSDEMKKQLMMTKTTSLLNLLILLTTSFSRCITSISLKNHPEKLNVCLENHARYPRVLIDSQLFFVWTRRLAWNGQKLLMNVYTHYAHYQKKIRPYSF